MSIITYWIKDYNAEYKLSICEIKKHVSFDDTFNSIVSSQWKYRLDG